MAAQDDKLVERLREMAPEEGLTIRCSNRTSREMNADIRQAANRIKSQASAQARIAALMDEIEGYGFTDKHGHPLANCAQWKALRNA